MTVTNKQIEIDSDYFRNILEKINEIDFYTFSKIGKLWDAGEIIFELSKNNLNIKVFYSGIMLRDHRLFKYNKNIDNLNKIFEELQIKIGKKEWYNNILEKYNIKKI